MTDEQSRGRGTNGFNRFCSSGRASQDAGEATFKPPQISLGAAFFQHRARGIPAISGEKIDLVTDYADAAFRSSWIRASRTDRAGIERAQKYPWSFKGNVARRGEPEHTSQAWGTGLIQ